jgi:methylase of polypeptide subunit release factors
MNSRSWYAGPLIAVHDLVASRLRRSRTVTQLLFGVRPTHKPDHASWDYSTIVLHRALKEVLRPGMRVLEVGVGEHALLSISAARVAGVDVTGVEISPEIAAQARATTEAHGVRVRILEGDFFAGDWGRYDLVFWNIPYVPRHAQARRSVRQYADPAWDGGVDGTDVMRRLLEIGPRLLTPGGALLLGITDFYLPEKAVEPIARAAGFRIARAVRVPVNPSTAYLLTLAGPAAGSGG